jgi:alkylhydroperoxidase family enzyme
MARISFVDDEVYQQILGSQQTANLLRIIFHSPKWAESFVRLAAVQMSSLSLDPICRELVILQSARMFGAAYVWAQHLGISAVVGVSDAQREALQHQRLESDVFTPRQQAVLRLTLSLPREALPRDEFDSIRQCLSEQEVVECIALHGLAYTVSRLTNALEIEVDPIDGAKMMKFVDQVDA